MRYGTVSWGKIERNTFPTLRKNESCRWLIIGGGIAGLAAAHFLLQEGERDIVIVEKNTIGSGSTGHSAGMLVFEPEHESWKHYVKKYGKTSAKRYYDAQQTAIEIVRSIITDNQIACEYEREELLVLANTPKERSLILSDFRARQSIDEKAELLSKETLDVKFKKSHFVLGEKIRGEISVNPLLFARGFSVYLKDKGVRIYERTEVESIVENLASANNTTITFKNSIACRGTYEKHPKLESFLTTICLTQKLKKRELAEIGLLESQMFSDDEGHSFFYGKITKDRRLMVGYGDLKLKKRVPVDYVYPPHVRTIEHFLKRTFPSVPLTIDSAWSAPYAITKGDLPLIEIKPHAAILNGGGTQITSIIAAEVAVRTLLKKKHPLKQLLLK